MNMKYIHVVQVIFLICLINVCASIDSEGNSATSTREIEQPLQQHEQDSDQQQLAQQEVHQLPSPEFSSYKNSATLPSYWLPLLYHLKHKRQPESNQMQLFESEGDFIGPSDVLSDDVISSRQQPSLSSAITGIRSNEVDLLDRLSLADSTSEPYAPSLRTLSTFSVPNRRWKILRTGRTGYSRHSRKPDASKLGSFAAGNQQLVSFIQDMFGSKDGRGVRFGLS